MSSIIEGIGGLMVPLDARHTTVIDLIAALRTFRPFSLPALILAVSATRSRRSEVHELRGIGRPRRGLQRDAGLHGLARGDDESLRISGQRADIYFEARAGPPAMSMPTIFAHLADCLRQLEAGAAALRKCEFRA